MRGGIRPSQFQSAEALVEGPPSTIHLAVTLHGIGLRSDASGAGESECNPAAALEPGCFALFMQIDGYRYLDNNTELGLVVDVHPTIFAAATGDWQPSSLSADRLASTIRDQVATQLNPSEKQECQGSWLVDFVSALHCTDPARPLVEGMKRAETLETLPPDNRQSFNLQPEPRILGRIPDFAAAVLDKCGQEAQQFFDSLSRTDAHDIAHRNGRYQARVPTAQRNPHLTTLIVNQSEKSYCRVFPFVMEKNEATNQSVCKLYSGFIFDQPHETPRIGHYSFVMEGPGRLFDCSSPSRTDLEALQLLTQQRLTATTLYQ